MPVPTRAYTATLGRGIQRRTKPISRHHLARFLQALLGRRPSRMQPESRSMKEGSPALRPGYRDLPSLSTTCARSCPSSACLFGAKHRRSDVDARPVVARTRYKPCCVHVCCRVRQPLGETPLVALDACWRGMIWALLRPNCRSRETPRSRETALLDSGPCKAKNRDGSHGSSLSVIRLSRPDGLRSTRTCGMLYVLAVMSRVHRTRTAHVVVHRRLRFASRERGESLSRCLPWSPVSFRAQHLPSATAVSPLRLE